MIELYRVDTSWGRKQDLMHKTDWILRADGHWMCFSVPCRSRTHWAPKTKIFLRDRSRTSTRPPVRNSLNTFSHRLLVASSCSTDKKPFHRIYWVLFEKFLLLVQDNLQNSFRFSPSLHFSVGRVIDDQSVLEKITTSKVYKAFKE